MPLSPTPRSVIKRGRERAQTDRAQLYAVLDSCLVCHLGIIHDAAPVVLPTGYGREGDTLYLHGSTGSASLMAASRGVPVSVAVTRLDGIVYARSVFHHSMNYSSAVIHGVPAPVTDPEEKLHALRVVTEHLAPGSWTHARQPTRKELAATAVLALSLHDASVKLRSGPPGDDDDDVTGHDGWAGVLPLHHMWGTPESCPLLPDDVPVPPHVTRRSTPSPPPTDPHAAAHR
ncbi:pyridoxamine 5'-phosphate oxidase family protein [Actinobacteria bacterium YIM 96077]|uniref:Pyridoxamine 5'-phosphate oxidase family protein n=1 Tax=Phytoactinopolyspora halophila TaxID=1981511 RepID=A0A329QA71_9ACTN|nr:pyridoxamine 5'-phosphate oxidase family protein [Actinobacteria bacterium YIM 96077]RAW09310.1 pyridoxamine 5'-phosphate oxidase family protein [Phytoactinopolyspora halophila]